MTHYARLTATRIRPIKGGHIYTPYPETTTHDIDWVAVERAINTPDCRIELNNAEKRAASLLMLQAGYTARQISTQLCIYQRQVERWRHDGKPLAIPPHNPGCSTPGCDQPHRAHGMCVRHYDSIRKAARKAQRTEQAAA
ncbi:helix-turn-helix domain-containing protein [Streptomyces sp.]|uniref:helix-turn-helix domain-containing protein n=1 Tax=Streptomyces sp. TaxID=1931 RepID=UPI002F93E2D3